MLLTDPHVGMAREIRLFVDRMRSQVDHIMVRCSSKTHGAACGFELSPLPLAESWGHRRKLGILKPSKSDGSRKGALKSYFKFHVGEELVRGFQLIKQDANHK